MAILLNRARTYEDEMGTLFVMTLSEDTKTVEIDQQPGQKITLQAKDIATFVTALATFG